MTKRGPLARERVMILGFPEYRQPARRLAESAGTLLSEIRLHRFPDGETGVRLPPGLPDHVVICRSLDRPNEKLLELVLAAGTARNLGASHVTLVAPYLCYMRQDMAFHPGEAVSQRIVGALLSNWFDALITVDPHLHRVHQLDEVVPVRHAIALAATAPMAELLAKEFSRPFLLGPDEESEQWVAAIARDRHFDYRVARKNRIGDRDVRIEIPEADYRGRDVVLVDDVASTGHTLEATARSLAVYRPASISVLVTHALLEDKALDRLHRAGIGKIFSSDSIEHASNRFSLASLVAGALVRLEEIRTG